MKGKGLSMMLLKESGNSRTPEPGGKLEEQEGNVRIQKKDAPGRSVFSFLSLLSDSNQRPRDYKSRALAN